MVKKFQNFVYESYDHDLSYCCFDWDDNILRMPSVIHLEHLIDGEWVREDVSTAKFAVVRKDPNWRYLPGEESFGEFRDFGPRGKDAFLDDTKEAIKNGNFAPSWKAFIEYLSKGTIFAIITARGHEPESIRKAVEYIIDNVLSDDQKHSLYANCLKFAYLFGSDYDSYERIPRGQLTKTRLISDYLDCCDFYGISSNYCKQKFGVNGTISNPEVGKEMAIKAFTKKVNDFGKKIGAKSVSIGFSDDDVRTSKHIEEIFRGELALTYAINYYVYDTSPGASKPTTLKLKNGVVRIKNPSTDRGVRTKISSQVTETQTSFGAGVGTWGMDGSVLPFTKWNNMTTQLYPNSKDAPTDDNHNRFKNQMGQLKDLTSDINKKKAN